MSCAAPGRIMLPMAQGGTRGSQCSHRSDRRQTGCADNQPAQGEADWINCPPRGAKPRCDASRPRAASSRQSEASIPPCRRVCGWTRRRFAGWAIASHPTAQNRLINKFGPDVARTLEGLSSAFAEMMPFAAIDATEPAESAATAGELTPFATTVAHGKSARRAQLSNPHGSGEPAASRAEQPERLLRSNLDARAATSAPGPCFRFATPLRLRGFASIFPVSPGPRRPPRSPPGCSPAASPSPPRCGRPRRSHRTRPAAVRCSR